MKGGKGVIFLLLSKKKNDRRDKCERIYFI